MREVLAVLRGVCLQPLGFLGRSSGNVSYGLWTSCFFRRGGRRALLCHQIRRLLVIGLSGRLRDWGIKKADNDVAAINQNKGLYCIWMHTGSVEDGIHTWTFWQAEIENRGTAVVRICVINSANVPVKMLRREIIQITVASGNWSNVSFWVCVQRETSYK